MSKGTMIILAILGVCALLVVSFLLGTCGKAVNTASKMADQTVFNADRHVQSYEDFHNNWQSFQQYEIQWRTAKSEIQSLRDAGQTDTDEYRSWIMQRDGAWNMMRDISQRYNKESQVAYQKIWKSKGLPERLDLPSS